MSKRNSVGSANTLFNYFTKTPPSNKKVKTDSVDNSPKANSGLCANDKQCKAETKKRERQRTSPSSQLSTNSDDEEQITFKKRKRIRIQPSDSDDSDTENKADNGVATPNEKVSLETKLQDSFKYEPSQSPQSRKSTVPTATTTSTPKLTKETHDTTSVAEEGSWTHCKLDWLKPDKIRDNKKRRPDHPDYDPRTLHVPLDFLNSQTPAHRQWWDIKSTHYDCVLFFKVGKFYELYHMDAAVGVNELGFSYMKGEFAHSGFPESAYARMASTLVSKGYRVARVEQTETPEMLQERSQQAGQRSKWDKVVRREVCQVTCGGTRVCGLQEPGPAEPAAAFLTAVAEEEQSNGCSVYGVCFVDTSIGLFHLGQFQDDKHSSRLLTTLAHYPPAVVVYDRKATSGRTCRLLSSHCANARRAPRPSPPPPERTLRQLASTHFQDGQWPQGLRPFLHKDDPLGQTPAENCYFAIKALGICMAYLTEAVLDIQILGMSQFTCYSPPDVLNKTLSQDIEVESGWEGGNIMVLDAITLRNLRIVQDEGCLYDKLNFCCTPMGKRLLYQWVCAPSCNISVIKDRQTAVQCLYGDGELCRQARDILNPLPDLDRLLAKVHSLGNLNRSKNHPDARAIFYEEKTYSKRKVQDFLAVLNGFQACLKIVELFCTTDSALLKTLTQFAPDGKFPDYRDSLKFFAESFDRKEAESDGRMLPGAGVDPQYDNTLSAIADIENDLKLYLQEQEKHFRCRLKYVGTDKKRYQLEVPQNAASRADYRYQLQGTRKGFKRYSTDETKDLLTRMMAAEEEKRTVLKDLSRRIFEKFSSNYGRWEAAVRAVATLDVLLAFAEFARQQTGDVCLPDVQLASHRKPYIKIVEGRHPCIPIMDDFIPNDTQLGVDGPSLLLLTGPNMGGKSTLMRQVALITVLAHLGSYVPAEACSLTAVDRIFTRLGASDDILAGQSTFLVEMSETAAIVAHATPHSLLLLDELGRGTSTYDGAAIASAVCEELARRGCRTVFSTHYHSVVHHLATHRSVALGHMACMVETDETAVDKEDQIPEETITFLYKLSPGACPKSYGFNAARLAGIPRDIIAKAHLMSRKMEREVACVRALKAITMKGADPKEIRDMLSALNI